MDHNQVEWISAVRIAGLLLLIDYCIRHLKKDGAPIPGDLARSYVSKLARPKNAQTIQQPLPLLCHLGIFVLLRPAVFGHHIITSAVYGIHPDYRGKERKMEVMLPPKLRCKREQAEERKSRRLNQKYPFRSQLLQDLKKLSLSPEALKTIANLVGADKKTKSMQFVIQTIGGNRDHFVKVNERGQITTSMGSCPRELKNQLLLDGEKAVSCDISHAHHCFLPTLISGRIEHLKNEGAGKAVIERHEAERELLRSFLSTGDYYQKLCRNPHDKKERQEKKLLLTMMLNWPNAKCEANGLYLKLKAMFPITFEIVADIKRKDHRTLGKQLQNLTARVVRTALLELQKANIRAIPDVDALLCQERNRETVCETLGRALHESTGVCAKVGGIRYQIGSVQNWDDEAPSDDGLDYDEWEERRTAKTIEMRKS